ncbi:MAG: diacylglycerol/lipid kinase family protein [Chloroflexota bacterium]
MKALLIYNSHAGQRDRTADIKKSVSRLSAAGWQVDLAQSTHPTQIEQLARLAVEKQCDAVVVAGGDGTINAAIQALAYQPIALGVIPIGTTNVWAREMGIPLNVSAATETLLNGEIAQIDLGMANKRYFIFVASAGFDASVTRGVDVKAKRRLGILAYLISAVVEAMKLRGEDVSIYVDGRVHRQRVLMALAHNVRLYGGVLKMSPEAYADDGLLDCWVFKGRGLLAAIYHIFTVLLGLHPRDPGTDYYRSARIVIHSKRPIPVQLDGDYYGMTPVAFSAAPGALRVIIPPGPHPQLRQGTMNPKP